jgi:hypothetical protein
MKQLDGNITGKWPAFMLPRWLGTPNHRNNTYPHERTMYKYVQFTRTTQCDLDILFCSLIKTSFSYVAAANSPLRTKF